MSESAKTILILDDEKFIRESFLDYFSDHLWTTLEAGSGEEALELLQHESPDCAIVDVRLPGMDGNEFILKANKINPKMAFVICTGSPEYDVVDELLKMRVVSPELFRKPVVEIHRLEETIFMLIDKLRSEEAVNE